MDTKCIKAKPKQKQFSKLGLPGKKYIIGPLENEKRAPDTNPKPFLFCFECIRFALPRLIGALRYALCSLRYNSLIFKFLNQILSLCHCKPM